MRELNTQRALIQEKLSQLSQSVPGNTDPTARDWSGFFMALAAFLSQILPLIAPLFTKTDPEA